MVVAGGVVDELVHLRLAGAAGGARHHHVRSGLARRHAEGEFAEGEAAEILAELNYIEALPVFVGDQAPPLPALLVPVAAGIGEELSPVLASIPLSQIGLHLMRLNGKRSYNFPDDEARREHYDTIHRVTIGDPA